LDQCNSTSGFQEKYPLLKILEILFFSACDLHQGQLPFTPMSEIGFDEWCEVQYLLDFFVA